MRQKNLADRTAVRVEVGADACTGHVDDVIAFDLVDVEHAIAFHDRQVRCLTVLLGERREHRRGNRSYIDCPLQGLVEFDDAPADPIPAARAALE